MRHNLFADDSAVHDNVHDGVVLDGEDENCHDPEEDGGDEEHRPVGADQTVRADIDLGEGTSPSVHRSMQEGRALLSWRCRPAELYQGGSLFSCGYVGYSGTALRSICR